MIAKIQFFIEKHQLITSGSTIILGLSGGPDSMFLLHFLHTYYGNTVQIIAAHLDHQWRTDSANDFLFCQGRASHLNIPFIGTTLADLSFSFKNVGSKEAVGRQARRFFLEQIKEQYQADTIALGHHLQDQEETFFIRLIRGTTLTGLCSMHPKLGPYIRPLLETNKTDIIAYLEQHDIPYLKDPSNELPHFLRNRIRSQVIPAIAACDERFDANFIHTIKSLQETETFLDQLALQTWQTLSVHPHGIKKNELLALPAIMQYRVIMHWLVHAHVAFSVSRSFLNEIIRFLHNQQLHHRIHHQWLIKKSGGNVFIEKSLF